MSCWRSRYRRPSAGGSSQGCPLHPSLPRACLRAGQVPARRHQRPPTLRQPLQGPQLQQMSLSLLPLTLSLWQQPQLQELCQM